MDFIDIHTHYNSPVFSLSEKAKNAKSIYSIEPEDHLIDPCSLGLHPWHLENYPFRLQSLIQQAISPMVVAIGEAGLDKLCSTPLTLQQQAFEAHILLSEELQKPLIIHCVKAWRELETMRKKESPSQPWIIHGFRGKPELATQLLNKGYYLSFGTLHNPISVRLAWPLSILSETDDKDISIVQVVEKLADTLALPFNQVAKQLVQNAQRIFRML